MRLTLFKPPTLEEFCNPPTAHNRASLETLFRRTSEPAIPGRTKYCYGVCQQLLPLAAFNKSGTNPSGRQPYCRQCVSQYNKKRYAESKKKRRKRSSKRP